MKCVVEGCPRERHQRRLMCSSHYTRKLKYGDPLAGQTRKGALLQFLREHVSYAGDDCLAWPFGNKGNGYGHLRLHKQSMSASRAMCILAYGNPPSPSHDAAHSCGKGHLGCVNPRHLRWATRLENMCDAVRAGTTSKGEAHAKAIKLGLGVSVEELTKEASAA